MDANAPDEALAIPDQYPERNASRSGGDQPPAHASGRIDPPPGCRLVQLAPHGAADPAESGTDHPRGDESLRCVRASHAGGTAGRVMAGVAPLVRIRSRAAAHQGPASAGFCRRAHSRGSDYRHRAPRAEELPPTAGELLSDPDE